MDRGHYREAGDDHKNSEHSEQVEEDMQDAVEVSEIAVVVNAAFDEVR